MLRRLWGRTRQDFTGNAPSGSDEVTFELQRRFEARQVFAFGDLDGAQRRKVVVLDLAVEQYVSPLFEALDDVHEADFRGAAYLAERVTTLRTLRPKQRRRCRHRSCRDFGYTRSTRLAGNETRSSRSSHITRVADF